MHQVCNFAYSADRKNYSDHRFNLDEKSDDVQGSEEKSSHEQQSTPTTNNTIF
jgi:hypothetical protein